MCVRTQFFVVKNQETVGEVSYEFLFMYVYTNREILVLESAGRNFYLLPTTASTGTP